MVASVEVTRRWPGTVRISITERHPVVTAIAADGTWREIDLSGRVLAERPDRPALLLVEGPVPIGGAGSFVPPQAATAVRAAAALPNGLRAVITKATWDASGNASLVLGSGVPVRLGSTDRVAEQMIALAALLPALGMTPVTEIDLSVPDRPVVSHPPAAPPASPTPHNAVGA
jgi:cell division protein FtsQ